MSAWTIIPTCDDPMSIYTLLTFVGYSLLLLLVGRVAVQRLDQQEDETADIVDAINELKIGMAVMQTSLKNIEKDSLETKSDISKINQTLLDKLT